MLASDTQAISDYLKQEVVKHYALTEENTEERFADTRDTLCYATNDNQSAVFGMLSTDADLAIVVGGYNSSNTSHLVELCEEKLPTFYIMQLIKYYQQRKSCIITFIQNRKYIQSIISLRLNRLKYLLQVEQVVLMP
jgi:4-hydroxy-3-methylbut-2-enyl diphosphate reductase IspH